ncbi:flagellar basal body-associated FliL family protein [Clostridium swellfunianum]|uniref:flagellar basal body-associated FliL family protein n=1 Tax=Clostridium swellfunianum TaxID=1367462 RepID=UPI002030DB0A|nr:flagellar basal body-associated FliL family protein [Clostridium swellfunianum]MCM0650441.1 flagellar basal body-associated FliL family protein [Clostridium swellfunianum]
MAEKKEKVKEKGKGNALRIIIIVLLVILIFGGSFGGYLLYTKISGSNSIAENKTPNPTVQNSANDLSPYTYNMDEFLVNLSDEGGKRFFKAKLYLGYEAKKQKDMEKELEEKKPIIRDAINGVLRSKKASDFASQKNVEDLKKEILTRISAYFEKGKVTNIYFYEILIQ